MSKIINGKKIAEKIEKDLKKQVKKLKAKPKLVVVLVGDDKPSQIYVRRKSEAAKRVGIDFQLYKFTQNITQKKLIQELKNIQKNNKLNGLIVQLPLPATLDTDEILNTIKPEIDVDCLTDTNQNKLKNKTSSFLPPTPQAILSILEELKINLKGKTINILGRGRLVGKPLALMLHDSGAKITICHSQTTDLLAKCLEADIIISATGKQNLLKSQMIKKQAIIIDAGSNLIGNKLQGDIDYQALLDKVAYITPTPGGVGPITVAHLLANTVLSAKRKFGL